MDKKDELVFRYVYPSDLRDFYANGLYGGVTPRNELYIHFYSERHPIPKKAMHKITNGVPSDEPVLETGGNAVRLIQASIIMDLSTAISLKKWLNEKIDYMQKIEGDKDGISSEK